ncbi:hypothetical protein ACHAXN_002489 [Cyclotella atomus]
MSGLPKGRRDNPYNQRKERSESDQQRDARIQKMAQTCKDNNAQKKANKAKRKEEDLKKKAEQAKAGFFAPRQQLKKTSLPLQNNVEKAAVPHHGKTGTIVDNAVIDEDISIDSEEIKIIPTLDVMFNLDIDEDEVKADYTLDTMDECGVNSDGGGIQQEYVEAVQKRVRDEQLCELTLGKTMDKSLQTSTWTKNLSDDQKKYTAADVAVSLQVHESLSKLTNLSCRLTKKEANAGLVVDVVPSNGNQMSMASRSATGTIVGSSSYVCPVGYKNKNSKAPVTLADLGTIDILVPLDMLPQIAADVANEVTYPRSIILSMDTDLEWEELEKEMDEAMTDLTSKDIELFRAAVFESKEAKMGRVPLRREGLDDAPSPERI